MRADAEQLLQVFLNLSLNARAGDAVGRQAHHLDGAAQAGAPRCDAAFLEVRFRDTGVGHPGRRSEEPVHPVLHDQGQGHRPRPADQPAHHREPRRHHRGAQPQPAEGATFTVLLPIEAGVYADRPRASRERRPTPSDAAAAAAAEALPPSRRRRRTSRRVIAVAPAHGADAPHRSRRRRRAEPAPRARRRSCAATATR